MTKCKNCGAEIADGTEFCDNCKNTSAKKKKSPLKIIIPIIAVILVATIVAGVIFLSGGKSDEEKLNIAVYLQGTQLKYSHLDEINPIMIYDGYPHNEKRYEMVNYGMYYDTAGFIEDYMYLKDANTIVYPLPKERSSDSLSMKELNLTEGMETYGNEKTERIEKFYSQDKRYVYFTDDNYGSGKYLQCYDLNKNEVVFYIENIYSLLGIKNETGEIFYLKEQGTGKMELYKTTDGKNETRVDYGIASSKAFYATGEAYFCKEDGLYYFNGTSSKKILSEAYFSSETFATGVAVGAVASDGSLNVIIKDKVSVVECVTPPRNIKITSNGSTIYYLDNYRTPAFIMGRTTYGNTTDVDVGDLYKISIVDSQVGSPTLYDTEVDDGEIVLHKDGISYFKNYIRISSVAQLDFPSYYTVGDFYVNGKLVGEKVSFVEYVSQNEIYYISDVPNLKNIGDVVVSNVDADEAGEVIESFMSVYSEIKEPENFTAGTLKKYDGTQSITIAENVHDYYIKDNGQILMLTNYNEETYCSELYLYDENGNIFIDYDVADIIKIG